MVRTRIAPSPTGFPHVATIYQAIFDSALAKKLGGQFVLRLEDTDQKRFVEGSEEVIYQSLDWVGIKMDESPRESGEFGPYRQSERLPLYQKYARELVEKGQAYYCFCSRERLEKLKAEQAAGHKPPMYDGLCQTLPAAEVQTRLKGGEKYVIRLKVPETGTTVFIDLIRGEISFENALIDDQVLLKSDGFPTYHLAVVVDDHLMEITHVIRGEEWISSTPKQVLLYRDFGWTIPEFSHLPLLKNSDGSKISKRHGHTCVTWYREQGILPETLVNFLTQLVWNHPEGKEIYSFDDFARLFEFKEISLTGPRFDLKKLEWLNGEYIRAMNNEELIIKIIAYLSQYSKNPLLRSLKLVDLEKVVPIIKERIKKLSEFEGLAGFLFIDELTYASDLEINKDYLQSSVKILSGLKDWQSDTIEAALRQLASDLKVKAGELFTSLRNAVSGSKISPPLFESMAILGRERTLARFQKFL